MGQTGRLFADPAAGLRSGGIKPPAHHEISIPLPAFGTAQQPRPIRHRHSRAVLGHVDCDVPLGAVGAARPVPCGRLAAHVPLPGTSKSEFAAIRLLPGSADAHESASQARQR